MSDEKRSCQNCSAELHGDFCSSCGQQDKQMNVPVKELAAEFIEILPSFDRRLKRSLIPLLFTPGFLTLEYLSGKRKQYLSPFKLYFAVSFLFFLVSSYSDDYDERKNALAGLSKDSTLVTPNDSAFVSVSSGGKGLRITLQDSTAAERVFSPEMITALHKLKTNPGLMFDKIKEHRPKIIFVLMPIFASLLKMLYFRSRMLYIKHLVFSFYFHSFLFTIFLLSELLDLIDVPLAGYLSASLLLTVPVHLYFGLKRVYDQSGWKTGVKLLLLSVIYTFTFFMSIAAAALIIIFLFYR